MNNLALANVIVANTGTGNTYTPSLQEGHFAEWKLGVGGGRMIASLRRSPPKVTLVSAGVERFEFKRRIYHVIDSAEHVGTINISSTVPVAMTAAQRTAIVDEAIFLANDAVLRTAIETGAMPT